MPARFSCSPQDISQHVFLELRQKTRVYTLACGYIGKQKDVGASAFLGRQWSWRPGRSVCNARGGLAVAFEMAVAILLTFSVCHFSLTMLPVCLHSDDFYFVVGSASILSRMFGLASSPQWFVAEPAFSKCYFYLLWNRTSHPGI